LTAVVSITMKKLITSFALAAVVVFGFTGCTTTTGNQSPALTQEQLDKASILLKGSVRSGLLLVIDKNGDDAKDYVCLAGESLSTLLRGTNYTPGYLEKRLYALPTKELKKTEVQLAVSAILTAYEIYYGDYVAGRIDGNKTAYVLLSALRDGALGACAFSEGDATPSSNP